MTKLRVPLLSFKASRSLANTLTFQQRGNQVYVRRKPRPHDARSQRQLWHRYLYRQACQYWNTLTATQKQTWESNARLYHMTGFAFFMRQELNRLEHLLCCLPFDEAAGTIAYDMSGRGNHGVIYGASWASGKINSGLEFDGIDDWVQIPGITQIPEQFSYELWASVTQAATWYQVLSKPNDSLTQEPCMISMNTGVSINYGHWTTVGGWAFWISSTFAPTLGVKYHIVVTYDGLTGKLYINSILEDEATGDPPVATSNPYQLGKLSRVPPTFLKGTVDEFRLYDAVLTQDEVTTHYLREES